MNEVYCTYLYFLVRYFPVGYIQLEKIISMVLESTMICVDNSEYMRNGDFIPSRLHAQQDAIYLVCRSKLQMHPENDVGLITLAKVQVLTPLTNDRGKLLRELHQLSPNDYVQIIRALRVAQLALRHRQGANHKMRIIAFIGSPCDIEEEEFIKLAKKLKKEKVNVDFVCFGQDVSSSPIFSSFINILNGKDGSGSNLIEVLSGPYISDKLLSTPIIAPSDDTQLQRQDSMNDPELAMALSLSLEEYTRANTGKETDETHPVTLENSENQILEQAIAMSKASLRGYSEMSEEEQINAAIANSLKDTENTVVESTAAAYEPLSEERSVHAEDEENGNSNSK